MTTPTTTPEENTVTNIKSLPTARVRGRRYGYQIGLRTLYGLTSRYALPCVWDGATIAEARRVRLAGAR